MYITDPGPPTNIILRKISNRRVQATWTPPAGASGATYLVYINTMNVNSGGTEVTGTTYTTETLNTGSTVTIRVRATTGTYLSVPAVSDTLTVSGKRINDEIIYILRCFLLASASSIRRVSGAGAHPPLL